MASPSSHAGYPNRQLTTLPLPTPLPFRRVPGQAPTIIGLRYKEEPPGAKSRLPISLAGVARKVPRKSVACFHAEIYRLGSGITRRGVFAASRLEWHLVDHLGYAIRQLYFVPQPAAAVCSRVWKNTSRGKEKSGPMNTQTRPSDRFSLSLGDGIKGECIFLAIEE